MTNKLELKLEVDKTYILPNKYKETGITAQCIFALTNSNGISYVMMNIHNSHLFWVNNWEGDFNLIKEHQEPIKITKEYYILHSDDPPSSYSILDILIGLYTDGYLYKEKEFAKKRANENSICKKIKKLKFNIEEIVK